MIKPKKLVSGDLIAVAAPASPFEPKEFLAGVKKLKELGFRVKFREDIFSKELYLAGHDSRRADELNEFFADPEVAAIFFARGGYGTQRVLPLLDIDLLKDNPKIIAGYSDITALHSFLNLHGVGGNFYAPTIAKHFNRGSAKTLKLMFSALTTNEPLGKIFSTGARVLKHGNAGGKLTGGCLSLIASSLGTSYEIDTAGSILFIEDVGEAVYTYDRMLTQLKAAGKLRDVSGIIFGSMSLKKGEKPEWFLKMLKNTLKDFPGPIVYNFPCGHLPFEKNFATLPFGVEAELSTKPLKLNVTEGALL